MHEYLIGSSHILWCNRICLFVVCEYELDEYIMIVNVGKSWDS